MTLAPSKPLAIRVEHLDIATDPLDVFANSDAEHRMFWAHPNEDLEFAAIGAEQIFTAADDPTDRFESLAMARRIVAESLAPADVAALAVKDLPRLVGGFAFSAEPSPHGPPWSNFGAGRLVLPEVLVIKDLDGVRAIVVGDQPLESVIDTSARRASTHDAPDDLDATTCPAYTDLVERSLKAIGERRFEKVVSARMLSFPATVDAALVVSRLRDSFPECATFAIAAGDETFLGASPERLVSVRPGHVRTAALAGSKPRGAAADDDARFAHELFTSPKERAEHRFVVEAITSRLESLGLAPQHPADPEVLKLRSIQHLYTPISVQASEAAIDPIEIVGALHPTPAVAGSNEVATQWIEQNEGINRGWYAGPVGWVGLAGEAEFRVALRSGLVDADGAHLYAGCGIVEGSDPDSELHETVTKLRPMLNALGVGLLIDRP